MPGWKGTQDTSKRRHGRWEVNKEKCMKANRTVAQLARQVSEGAIFVAVTTSRGRGRGAGRLAEVAGVCCGCEMR